MRIYKFKDLTGKKFGRLTVLRFNGKNQRGDLRWLCQCECGNQKSIVGGNLNNNTIRSCGCLRTEINKRRGPQCHNWKGGRTIDDNGYVRIYCREHPNVDSKGYVREHSLVMEKHLGRYLLSGETIHHKNGIRRDNRIENLELRLRNHHPSGQSVENDLIPYWIEMIKRYKPEVLQ